MLVLLHDSLVTWGETEMLADAFSKYCSVFLSQWVFPSAMDRKKSIQGIPQLTLELGEGFSSVDSQVGRQLMAPGKQLMMAHNLQGYRRNLS